MTAGRNSTHEIPEKGQPELQVAGSSKIKKAGRVVAKSVVMATGFDVIYKDAKRMRPRYPKLWKDIFNAREILRESAKKESSKEGVKYSTAARNAALTSLTGFGVLLYLLLVMAPSLIAGDASVITKISVVLAMSFSLMHSLIYGWITLQCLHKSRLSTAKTPMPNLGKGQKP